MKICVVTGTRAEYGLLVPLLKEIQFDPSLELQLVVTGSHLSARFGMTYKEIEADGFQIVHKVDICLVDDNPLGIAKSIGLGVLGFSEAFKKIQPDIIVVLGDRYEILAAAQAAMVARIPIAHIHGGELTMGAIDDAIRHCITKMAHLHFTAAESYRKRVIQMGEQPSRVFNVGALALERISSLKLMSQPELEKNLGFQFGKTNFLITYHPVTLSHESPVKSFDALTAALDQFPDAKIIFTKGNADTNGYILLKKIDEYASCRPNVKAFVSLGQHRYLSAMQICDVVIGNSSSGIIEAPALKRPTVNIGERQAGRLRAGSIIDCAENTTDIINSIRQALSLEFKEVVDRSTSPYSRENTSSLIKKILQSTDLKRILIKSFCDLPLL